MIYDPEFGARKSLPARIFGAISAARAETEDTSHARAITLSKFQQSMKVRRLGLTYLIAVSATSKSPAKAADLANALSSAYIRQQVGAKVDASLAARDVLEQQIESARVALASYENSLDRVLDETLEKLVLATPETALHSLSTRLQTVESQLVAREHDRETARLLMQSEDWSALAKLYQDTELLSLGQSWEATIEALREPANAQDTRDLHTTLANLESQLNERGSVGLTSVKLGISALGTEAIEVRATLRDAIFSGAPSPELLTSVFSVQQRAEIAKTHYQNLLSRLHDLETSSRVQLASSRVVSEALAPVKPGFPNRNLVLLATLATAMGLGVSLAFLKEYYVGGITSADQLSELFQSPTAAVIPVSNAAHDMRLSVADLVIDAPLSPYSESIRCLRASIDQSFRTKQRQSPATATDAGQIVLITSAMQNEGKTTTALALARTYALSGRKTLLIDADLRQPSLHRHLGLEPQAGFLDYLNGTLEPKLSGSFYARDPASSLALIMGAVRSEFPTDQLLSSAKFDTLLNQAREVYEIIIVDSSPLLPVVDARYIAHHADALVMTVKWAATNQADIRAAIQPLRSALNTDTHILPVLGQMSFSSEQQKAQGYYGAYAPET